MGLRIAFPVLGWPGGVYYRGIARGFSQCLNYLDGLDGLAAGSGIINLFFLAVILNNTASILKPLRLYLPLAILGFYRTT